MKTRQDTDAIFESVNNEIVAIERFIDKQSEKLSPLQNGALTIRLAGETMIKAILSQGWSLEVTKDFVEEVIYPQAIIIKTQSMQ